MQHPVYLIPEGKRPLWFWWGVAFSFVVFVPLISVIESGPGIVQLSLLVFAGTPDGAEAILASWTQHDRLAIANGLEMGRHG